MSGREPVYRGRLAPSPTGRLHLGVARTALVAWLCARKAGGVLIHRVEDLDGPRVVPGAAQAIADELRFLGLDWDEGFDSGGSDGPYLQSQRSALYESALGVLAAQGWLFPCSCTRAEIAEASAPHGDLGPLYPGTCRHGARRPDRPVALRFSMREEPFSFVDGVMGPTELRVRDDFVVRRSDGLYAYQLAVVVDDGAMGVTEVVRGADLLGSTPRQLALYRALGLPAPRFAHVPLVLGPDGQRLAKRHGSIAVVDYRRAGVPATQLVGALGASLGLCPVGERCAPEALLEGFALGRIAGAPTTFKPSDYGLPELWF